MEPAGEIGLAPERVAPAGDTNDGLEKEDNCAPVRVVHGCAISNRTFHAKIIPPSGCTLMNLGSLEATAIGACWHILCEAEDNHGSSVARRDPRRKSAATVCCS